MKSNQILLCFLIGVLNLSNLNSMLDTKQKLGSLKTNLVNLNEKLKSLSEKLSQLKIGLNKENIPGEIKKLGAKLSKNVYSKLSADEIALISYLKNLPLDDYKQFKEKAKLTLGLTLNEEIAINGRIKKSKGTDKEKHTSVDINHLLNALGTNITYLNKATQKKDGAGEWEDEPEIKPEDIEKYEKGLNGVIDQLIKLEVTDFNEDFKNKEHTPKLINFITSLSLLRNHISGQEKYNYFIQFLNTWLNYIRILLEAEFKTDLKLTTQKNQYINDVEELIKQFVKNKTKISQNEIELLNLLLSVLHSNATVLTIIMDYISKTKIDNPQQIADCFEGTQLESDIKINIELLLLTKDKKHVINPKLQSQILQKIEKDQSTFLKLDSESLAILYPGATASLKEKIERKIFEDFLNQHTNLENFFKAYKDIILNYLKSNKDAQAQLKDINNEAHLDVVFKEIKNYQGVKLDPFQDLFEFKTSKNFDQFISDCDWSHFKTPLEVQNLLTKLNEEGSPYFEKIKQYKYIKTMNLVLEKIKEKSITQDFDGAKTLQSKIEDALKTLSEEKIKALIGGVFKGLQQWPGNTSIIGKDIGVDGLEEIFDLDKDVSKLKIIGMFTKISKSTKYTAQSIELANQIKDRIGNRLKKVKSGKEHAILEWLKEIMEEIK